MKQLAWSILLVLPLSALADEVYRSIDENGQVVYSDLPNTLRVSELVVVDSLAPSAPAGSPLTRRPDSEEGAESDDRPTALIPREGTPEEIAEDRARNCDYARQMQETYSVSHRLFRTGPDGEREYLSDDELSAARTKAESDVATWCG